MFGGKSQGAVRPIALGSTLNSSTYGQTIPVIYGRMKSALYMTWEANIRTSGSKFKKKKGSQTFAANVDFLLGHNPILGPLEFWMNQNQKLPLGFVTATTGLFTFLTDTYSIISLLIAGGVDPSVAANFYSLLAIVADDTADFGYTSNDYGALGPVTFPKVGAIPLWNAAQRGPDPGFPNALRTPQCFIWTPDQGDQITFTRNINASITLFAAVLLPGGAALYGKKQSGTDVPVAALNLTFEPILGDGPEYVGVDETSGVQLASQQIFYPSYAGLGSSNFQTGASGMPEVSCEVQGAFGTNPGGDADFADMIEDILKQGLSQPGNSTLSDPLDLQAINTHRIQHGLGCYNLPGIVNGSMGGTLEPFNYPINYFLPNQAGNFLVVMGSAGNPAFAAFPGGISDTAGDTWTAVVPAGYNGGMWWAKSVGWAGPKSTTVSPNQVIVNPAPSGAYASWIQALEITGVDEFDASAYVVGQRSCSITTTNKPGLPAYIVVLCNYGIGFTGGIPYSSAQAQVPGGWAPIACENARFFAYAKTVYQPGTYTFTGPGVPVNFGTPNTIAMSAFKATVPSQYARPLGDILDMATMDLTRAQCRAYGLWGSMVMDSQQKASEWLDILYKAANAAPVWSGFKLKSIPYSEQSYAGNGSIYKSPTATGPVATIPITDFIYDTGQPVYQVEREAQVDVPNILQLQIPSRDNEYNDVVVSQPMTAAVALFGSRKDSPQQFRCIVDPVIARRILMIQNNRRNNLRNTFSFKLNARWKLLEAMDLITLPADPFTKQPAIDVRITDIEEDEKYALNVKAQPFIFGTNAPIPYGALGATDNQPYNPLGGPTIEVNTPIIFEPTPRLLNQQNQGQIWTVVSVEVGTQITAVSFPNIPTGSAYLVGDVLNIVQAGGQFGTVKVTAINGSGAPTKGTLTNAGRGYTVASGVSATGGHGSGATIDITAAGGSYSGCLVYLSTDGGNSYTNVGQINGNATTGFAVNNWPAANDPDTTNDLQVNLVESQGALDSYRVADEDGFNYPCYIEGGFGPIPYELMAYALAVMNAPNLYTLTATGGNHLRRGVFGAPLPAQGVFHAGAPGGVPSGASRFAFLGPPGTQPQTGIFKINLDPRWIGVTLYFKFVPFSSLGAPSNTLADVTAYPYTPTGVATQENPDITYVNTPYIALARTTTTNIHLPSVTTQFPSNKVQYNARDFTIAAPGVKTVYYVTIADPHELGEVIGVNSLTATCSTSPSLVGTPGNTYMGFIQVDPSGTASDITGPGGWPPPFVAVVGA